jgi:Flp pilus assembly protein TadG
MHESSEVRVRRSRGQALVELAVTLPFLLLLLLAAVDFGRLFYVYVGVENAAREGAAYGAYHPTWWAASGPNAHANPANITYVARQELGGDSSLTVTVSCATACAPTTNVAGNTIVVSVSRPFSLLVPFILSNVSLGASSTAVIQ